MIVLLVALPLAAALLLALAPARAATVVHALATLATLGAGLAVTVDTVRGVPRSPSTACCAPTRCPAG